MTEFSTTVEERSSKWYTQFIWFVFLPVSNQVAESVDVIIIIGIVVLLVTTL